MRRLAVGGWRLAVGLMLASCASAPAPPPPPKLTEIPRAVLDVFCGRLHDEGVSSETTVDVLTTTQPLITPAAINGLAEAAFWTKPFDSVMLSDTASREAAPLPVVVPRGACAWRGVDENARRAADVMTIELSSPFRNPFARDAYGLLARVSLARESATWYWVPLGAVDGRWAVGTPMLMGMR